MRKLLSSLPLLLLLIFFVSCSISGQDISERSTISRIFLSSPQRDFLTDSRYSNVLIEVMYVSSSTAGFNLTPTPADLEYLKGKITHYCHKKNVVIVVDDPIPYSQVPTIAWTSSYLQWFENKHALYSTVGDTVVLRVLYIPGVYLSAQETRGLAYGDYAFCLFRQQMASSRERAVLLHEFGHIIGLVNCGTRCLSDHEEKDSAHRPHCNNEKECVMYYSSPNIQNPDFDKACQDDLRGNGGR